MLLLIYPAIDTKRLQAIQAAAATLQIMNIESEQQAQTRQTGMSVLRLNS